MTKKEKAAYDRGFRAGLFKYSHKETFVRGYIHGAFNAGQKLGVHLADVDMGNLVPSNPHVKLYREEAEKTLERVRNPQ